MWRQKREVLNKINYKNIEKLKVRTFEGKQINSSPWTSKQDLNSLTCLPTRIGESILSFITGGRRDQGQEGMRLRQGVLRWPNGTVRGLADKTYMEPTGWD